MTFDLTPDLLESFHPLPGFALLRTEPPPEKEGSLYLPEQASEARTRELPVREGAVLKINRKGEHKEPRRVFDDCESRRLIPGAKVYYYGSLEAAENKFVVVKIPQVVAIREE